MPIYQYTALDAKGKTISGIQEAESQKHAKQSLANQALVLTKLNLVSAQKKQSWFVSNIGQKELSLYVQQLAMMLRAGMPIESALSILTEQIEQPRHKIIWSSIRSSVNEGISLSKAMEDFPQSFPNFLIASIASGEQSGRLDTVLGKTSDTLIRKHQFSSKIKHALVYPMVVSFVAFSVIVALLTFVVPQIIDVFSQLGKNLPDLTLGLIAVSDFTKNNIELFLVLFVSFYGFVIWLKRTKMRKRYWDKFWLSIPITRKFIKEVESIKFMRTLSTLLEGGVVMVDAIGYALASLDNIVIADKMQIAKDKIREGKGIADSFKHTGLFNPMSLQLIQLGEATGEIDNTLTKTTDMLEENFGQKINTSLSLFEPILILVMGVLVLIIVLAILLPIFDLNDII